MGQAGTEIEITPEMIEAGADAIDLFIGPGSESGWDPVVISKLVLNAALRSDL